MLKENWDFLGGKKEIRLRKRKPGKLIRFCKENDWFPQKRKIWIERTEHKNGIFYRFLNPIDEEIFYRVMGMRSAEKLISQDKLDFFKLIGVKFYTKAQEL